MNTIPDDFVVLSIKDHKELLDTIERLEANILGFVGEAIAAQCGELREKHVIEPARHLELVQKEKMLDMLLKELSNERD